MTENYTTESAATSGRTDGRTDRGTICTQSVVLPVKHFRPELPRTSATIRRQKHVNRMATTMTTVRKQQLARQAHVYVALRTCCMTSPSDVSRPSTMDVWHVGTKANKRFPADTFYRSQVADHVRLACLDAQLTVTDLMHASCIHAWRMHRVMKPSVLYVPFLYMLSLCVEFYFL